MGRRWSPFTSPQPDTIRSRKTTVTGLVHHVVCPFTPQLSLVLINPSQRDMYQKKVAVRLLNSNVGVCVFWLVAEELRRTVQEKDSLIAQLQQRIVELDLRCQFFETASHDGLLLWKVADVDQRISDAKERCIVSLYSPPFYAGRYGYKLCARVYFNGDGDGCGTHVSLFFVIMKASEQNCIFDPALVSACCVIFVNISNYVNRDFWHSVRIDNEHLRIMYELPIIFANSYEW